MKNKNEITVRLETAKAFVTHNAKDANPQIAEDIQGLLSQAMEEAKDDDIDGLKQTLNLIDSNPVNGWDLTSSVRSLL